jgi:hypothetical protein
VVRSIHEPPGSAVSTREDDAVQNLQAHINGSAPARRTSVRRHGSRAARVAA